VAGFSFAHDIPADITIQSFLKPQGQRLHFVVRVPLKAMRDIEFPKRGPGYLDLARVDEYLRDGAIQWISNFTEIEEGDARLAQPKVVDARVSVESYKSFASYDEAVAHITGPRLPNSLDLYWDQAMLDVLFEYPIQSDRSDFSIHPAFERLGLRVVTVLRFMPPAGGRAFEFTVIRAWSGSIRGGIRRHCDSCRWGSFTFLAESTTCFFCSAW
jgi:hypothetical protein